MLGSQLYTVQCSICNKHRLVVTDFRLHHTCSIIILWLHSLSGVIRSLLCNPHASSPAIINIRISMPFMQDTTRARARKYGKMRDCHLVARTCDNEVGVAISIRDPYTSPFTSRCKFACCLLLVRCLCSETVAIGFLSSVEPNFVERTALGSLKRRRSYSR